MLNLKGTTIVLVSCATSTLLSCRDAGDNQAGRPDRAQIIQTALANLTELTKAEGLVLISDQQSRRYSAVTDQTPWSVTCSRTGIVLRWSDVVQIQLYPKDVSPTHCDDVVPVIAAAVRNAVSG
jgi:hypothetical protein